MRPHALTFLMLIFAGALAAAAWSFGFSQAFHIIYVAIGAPDRPTLALLTLHVVLSFAFGCLGGIAVPLISWHALYRGTWIVVTAAMALIFGVGTWFAGADAIFGHLKSYGFWAFVAGMLSVPAVLLRRANVA